jgi:hypothetical protein
MLLHIKFAGRVDDADGLVLSFARRSRQCLLIAAIDGAGNAGHSRMWKFDAILRWAVHCCKTSTNNGADPV